MHLLFAIIMHDLCNDDGLNVIYEKQQQRLTEIKSKLLVRAATIKQVK